VDIFIADLHEDGAGIGEEIARDSEPIPQVGEVAVDAVAPGVAEGFDLLRLAGDVVGLAVLHVAAGGGPLEVAVELDAVGRVEVDALHLAAQALALGQAGHHLEAVAQDHAVGPVLVVLVELGLVRSLGNAVEVGEEVGGQSSPASLPASSAFEQVVDQHLGVDLLLDVERRRVDDEVAPVLLILAAPDELRVEVACCAGTGWFPSASVLEVRKLTFVVEPLGL
jgi:hypothetical protein